MGELINSDVYEKTVWSATVAIMNAAAPLLDEATLSAADVTVFKTAIETEVGKAMLAGLSGQSSANSQRAYPRGSQ